MLNPKTQKNNEFVACLFVWVSLTTVKQLAADTIEQTVARREYTGVRIANWTNSFAAGYLCVHGKFWKWRKNWMWGVRGYFDCKYIKKNIEEAPHHYSASFGMSNCWFSLLANPENPHAHDFEIFGRVHDFLHQSYLFLETPEYSKHVKKINPDSSSENIFRWS